MTERKKALYLPMPKGRGISRRLDETPGNDGGDFQGNSQVKLQVSLDYLSGRLSFAPLEAGKTPDQRCDLPLRVGGAGSLHLFDLGYFCQDTFAQLVQQKAYFLSRYQSQTALHATAEQQRVELLDLLPLIHLIRSHWRGASAFWHSLEGDFQRFAQKDKRRKSPSTHQSILDWRLS